MTLRSRFALILAVLGAATAAIVATAGYRVTANRLDREVARSLTSYSRELTERNGDNARHLCGKARPYPNGKFPATDKGDTDDFRGPVRPAGALVQCLDSTGAVSEALSDATLPVDEGDVAIAAAGTGIRSRAARIDGQDARLLTIGISGVGAIQVARTFEENDRVLGSLVTRYLALALGVTALAALAGWWLARRTTQPIRALTSVAEDIAANGRVDHDLELDVVARPGKDETGRLAASFATMVAALRQSREQQVQLVQDAGHELRTPLTSLRANVGVLRRHPDLPEDRRIEILDDLQAELKELTTLTNELVALAAENAEAEPAGPCDLADIAARSVERCRRRTGREIHTTLVPFPMVGRTRQLLGVVNNLLSNADKFSPPGSVIEVTVAPGELVVRDHGPGIEASDIPHVFDRFFRATAARTRPGSGLGLAIVHDAVAGHGGTVTAGNHPGGGAVFTVRLPVAGGGPLRDGDGDGAPAVTGAAVADVAPPTLSPRSEPAVS